MNTFLIIAIIVAVICVITYYKYALSQDVEEEEYESVYSLSHLTSEVAKAFANTQKENLLNLNLTKKQLEAERENRRRIRQNLKNAALGNKSAKIYIRSMIRDMLEDDLFGITPETIDNVIPFNNPGRLTLREKTDIILWIYYDEFGINGFNELFREYHLAEPKDISIYEEIKGALKYEVTKEQTEEIFDDMMSKIQLTYNDKLEVLTERIFADYKGFGAIDRLFDFAIDEIQGGMNGIAADSHMPDGADDTYEYSYDSVWVVYKGINIKLGFMSFGSQDELVRVAKNIYKYMTPRALSRNNGHVVAQMEDGSRVSVGRPPELDSWAFCVRKFDTVEKAASIPELFPPKIQRNSEILETLIMYIVNAMMSVIITGNPGDGKTTVLKTATGFIPSEKAIRIYELAPEMNAQFSFPKRNIKAFAETENVGMQEQYNFGKKFSANVSIISEVASAEMGVIAIESGRVGSEMLLSTNHATTTYNLITELTDHETTAGGYSSTKAAEEVVVHVINFDIHLARANGMRYIERITEVVPLEDIAYPSEKNKNLQVGGAEDTREYYQRVTDRKSYEAVDIVKFSLEDMTYHMVNKFSPTCYSKMLNKFIGKQREEFIKDMDVLYAMIGK